MPQIKNLTVNNGTTNVVYVPSGSDANATVFANRGSTLTGLSRIISQISAPSNGGDVKTRQRLRLDKRKEVTEDSQLVVKQVGLFDLGTVWDKSATAAERLAAFQEFKSLLNDADVTTAIVENEPFY